MGVGGFFFGYVWVDGMGLMGWMDGWIVGYYLGRIRWMYDEGYLREKRYLQ